MSMEAGRPDARHRSFKRRAESPSTIMNAIKIILALVAHSLALNSHANEITGRVTFKGTPPPERTVDLKSDPAIAAKHPKGLTTRHYQVHSDGGLRRVLVYIRGDFTNTTFAPPNTTPVLDHTNGLFQPYVMGIRVGQPLQLNCSDGTICGFHATANVNQDFVVTPLQDAVSRTLSKPEVPVRFECDLHPWNYAYLGVFAHPYFAVTDEQGRFTIREVPAGRYSLEVFHPRSGTSAKPVIVTDQPSTVDFEVIAR